MVFESIHERFSIAFLIILKVSYVCVKISKFMTRPFSILFSLLLPIYLWLGVVSASATAIDMLFGACCLDLSDCLRLAIAQEYK